MKPTTNSVMIIKYPDGSRQEVRPNMSHFKGNWDELAKSIAGLWFRDKSGNVMNVPYELR